MWAIDREPSTDNLNLDVTGIELNEKGYIKVDKYQNTNVSNLLCCWRQYRRGRADAGCGRSRPSSFRALVQPQAG
nr:Glutathione reductase [Candidatus Pantoea persica]